MKFVAVGDSGVGKTSLFVSYTTDMSIAAYDPPTLLCPTFPVFFDAYNAAEGKTVTLHLFDTITHEDYDRLRPLLYPRTDVFLICFSLVDPGGYENVRTKWYPEISHFGPTDARIVLVGTKLDLRKNPEVNEKLRDRRIAPIQYQQGVAMCKDINAERYCECSATTLEGVRAVFEDAMSVGLNPARKKRGCIIA